jgi:hypothetical protein
MPPPKDPIKYKQYIEKVKQNTIKQFSDPMQREMARQRAIKQFLDPKNRKKISNAAKKRCADPEYCKKLSKSLKGLQCGIKNPFYGKHHTEETRKKLSDISKSKCGETASNWQGGLSFEPYCPKFNKDIRNRVRLFWENKCGNPECNKSQDELNEKLSVHHVHYDKLVCCNDKPVMFIPLCRSCHSKTNYDRNKYERIYEQLIYDKYNGKSYYTKEEYEKL